MIKRGYDDFWIQNISPFQSNTDDEVGGDTEQDAVDGIDDLGEEICVEGAGLVEGPGKHLYKVNVRI